MKTNIVLIFFIIFFVLPKFSASETINDLNMIVDFVESYDKPTSVIAKVCWKAVKKITLARVLSNLGTPKTINFLPRKVEMMNKEDHILFIVDLKCSDATTFLRQANSNKMYTKRCRWLVLGKPINCSDMITSEFTDLNILVSSEFIVAQEIGNKGYILHAVYKINSKSKWIKEYFGTWTESTSLIKSNEAHISTSMRRKNFRGETIAASIVATDDRTKTELLEPVNLIVDSLTKNTFRNVNPLYEFLNASRELMFHEIWGFSENGSWNGMIGDLVREKADLAGTVTLFSERRLSVLEYLTHPSPSTAKFVFREPPLSYQNNLFVLPFKSTVWFCTIGFVFILICVLYINAIWERTKSEYCQERLDHTALKPNLSDITILVISAISQQGSYHELKGTLGRLVMFILFLTFLFLYASYSACIVALLQSISNQILTLADLLNSKLELGVEDEPYNRFYFSTATDPVRKAIYETKVAPKGSKPKFMNLEEGVLKLKDKPFAFNMNIGSGYRLVEKYFQEHEKCGLREIEFLQYNQPWLSCRKDSPNSEIYKIGYFRIKEHGISDRENRVVYAKKPVCSVRGSSFGSVNMMDFYPILLMLLYGMILAFLMLAVEIFMKKKQERHLEIV